MSNIVLHPAGKSVLPKEIVPDTYTHAWIRKMVIFEKIAWEVNLRTALERTISGTIKHKYPLKLWSIHPASRLTLDKRFSCPGPLLATYLSVDVHRVHTPFTRVPRILCQNTPASPCCQGLHRLLPSPTLLRADHVNYVNTCRPRWWPWSGLEECVEVFTHVRTFKMRDEARFWFSSLIHLLKLSRHCCFRPIRQKV